MLHKSRELREWHFSFYSTLSAFRIHPTFFNKKKILKKEKAPEPWIKSTERKKFILLTVTKTHVWRTECRKQMFVPGYVTEKCKYFIMKNILLCDHLRCSSVSTVQQFNKRKSKSIKMNEARQVFCIRWQKLFWELTNQWVQWYNDGSSASGTIPGNGLWMAIPIREAVLLSNIVLPMFQDLNTPE